MEGFFGLEPTEGELALSQMRQLPNYTDLPRYFRKWKLRNKTVIRHRYPTFEIAKWIAEHIHTGFYFAAPADYDERYKEYGCEYIF